MDLEGVLAELCDYGLLLATDPRLPSVTTLVAERPIRGSWWSSPQGRRIYAVLSGLTTHPDVATAKLINRKITFVHRALWDALVAIGTEEALWQVRGLSQRAKLLLNRINRDGEYLTSKARDIKSAGKAAAELERVLLIVAEDIHTDAGFHAKRLRSWRRWCRDRKFRPHRMTPKDAKLQMAQAAAALRSSESVRVQFPWS